MLITAIDHMLKDLFTEPRHNEVSFYVDSFGKPILKGLDFEAFEDEEVIEELISGFPFKEFETFMKLLNKSNKLNVSYCLAYSVSWKFEITLLSLYIR